MSYDVSVSFKQWPTDYEARWKRELASLGISIEVDDGAFEGDGWLPVQLTIAENATIPWAAEFHALGKFESGFERIRSLKRIVLSAKGEQGNAAAVWCAAALAAVTGGKLEDPQAGVNATAKRAIEILAKLMRADDFVRSFAGPDGMAALPPPAPVVVPPAPPKPIAIELDPDKPMQDYAASSRFEVGDQLRHPTFGEGIVEASEPGKLTIAFRSGRRVLAQSKTSGAGLARPPRIDHSAPVPGTKPGR